MKKTAVVIFVLLACTAICKGQADIHFSQFYETSILRNPALTGVFSGDYKFGIYYRNQWSSITNPYQTYLGTAESRVSVSQSSEDFFSFGILAFSDKAGSLDQKITGFYPAINYNKSLSPAHLSFLSFGFTGGFVQYSYDPTKATFNSQFINGQFDPNSPTLENLSKPKMGFWDIGTGICFNRSFGDENRSTLILGASGYHFTQPNFSYDASKGIDLNIRWNGNAAMAFELKNDVSMQLQANYAKQGTYQEIIAGAMLNCNFQSLATTQLYGFGVGAFYRYNDAIIPVIKIKYQNMSFGFSYDVNVSTLKDASNMQGAWEITLFMMGNFSSGNYGSAKKLMCPRF